DPARAELARPRRRREPLPLRRLSLRGRRHRARRRGAPTRARTVERVPVERGTGTSGVPHRRAAGLGRISWTRRNNKASFTGGHNVESLHTVDRKLKFIEGQLSKARLENRFDALKVTQSSLDANLNR